MEIMIRNLPDQITEKQIRKFLDPSLASLSISTYHIQKHKGKGWATLVFIDSAKGKQFMAAHGQTEPGKAGFNRVRHKLYHIGRPINFVTSKFQPDRHLLRSLEDEERDKLRAETSVRIKPQRPQLKDLQRRFEIVHFTCGRWDYVGQDLVFISNHIEPRAGRIIFGGRSLTFTSKPIGSSSPPFRLEMPYFSIQAITIGYQGNSSLTISLSEAPKMFEKIIWSETQPQLHALMRGLKVSRPRSSFDSKRISAVGSSHALVAASCLCYRFSLLKENDRLAIQSLSAIPSTPSIVTWDTPAITKLDFPAQMTKLNTVLTEVQQGQFPFEIAFQLQALAQNCVLPPIRVLGLAEVVRRLMADDAMITADALRRLSRQIPFAGPGTEASDLSAQTLSELLVANRHSIQEERKYTVDVGERYDHIAPIYRATVTPVGIYLYGPDPETTNRVIRKYRKHSDHFLQVSFMDESGEPIHFDRNASLEYIFHTRFKRVLEGVINIAGRPYEFLGFSHSSLRNQACWFMAPFNLDGNVIYARSIIKDLGDFSQIRSPAKCAARIGQAFSQTFSSVRLPPGTIRTDFPDIERNGRVFSDGVGTFSPSVLRMIWDAYAMSRASKPTLFQVRIAGAKGMISLDKRLIGDAVYLRPSMIKFKGSKDTDIEVCGAAFKPLPMYLNRQLVKILEDLGVVETSFLTLQLQAIERLRITTQSAINAALFLQRSYVGKAAKLPWLIKKLHYMGLNFGGDAFLRATLELAVLLQLRELKHRSRILVEGGVTLYGIMDETQILQEGQVYCAFTREGQDSVLEGRVVITRCPALHPGDVQLVVAVDVPIYSPLRALHNCIIFSSKGERDLPSMLSGGDLDGDLYNIIWDKSLYPTRISPPADYKIQKPIDIGRVVERSDITDFFIQFMENDQLGRIANLHQTLADHHDEGTFHSDCILLAGLHSTAVDFSKTGIPADLSTMPRYSRVRPDFLAPGPRVLIEEDIKLVDDEKVSDDEDNEDTIDDTPQTKYYKSHKILGKLYRAIDEHELLDDIQKRSKSYIGNQGLLDTVWKYVLGKTALIEWKHHTQFAIDIKEAYEDNLVESMFQYSSHPIHHLSEVEVFSGSILGKNGGQSKRQRENAINMKEKHERDVAYTVACIVRDQDGTSSTEALERSIACLDVGCNRVRVRKKVGALVSFGWVAATVCLQEVEKFLGARNT